MPSRASSHTNATANLLAVEAAGDFGHECPHLKRLKTFYRIRLVALRISTCTCRSEIVAGFLGGNPVSDEEQAQIHFIETFLREFLRPATFSTITGRVLSNIMRHKEGKSAPHDNLVT